MPQADSWSSKVKETWQFLQRKRPRMLGHLKRLVNPSQGRDKARVVVTTDTTTGRARVVHPSSDPSAREQ